MMTAIEQTVEDLRKTLTPIFAGMALDNLTGDSILWSSIQNARSRREIPDECFLYSGRKVLVRRDPFLDWWKGTLSEPGGRK